MDGDAHAFSRSLEERRKPIRLAVAVGVFKNSNPVALRTLVPLRRKMRLALDHQQPALFVKRHADGMDDVRLSGEQLDDQTGVVRLRDVRQVRGNIGGCGIARPDTQEKERPEKLLWLVLP